MLPNKKSKINLSKDNDSCSEYEPESDFEDSENEDIVIDTFIVNDDYEDEEEEEEEEETESESLNKIIKSSKEGKIINKLFMEELNKGKNRNKNPVEDTLEYFCNLEESKRKGYLDKLKK